MSIKYLRRIKPITELSFGEGHKVAAQYPPAMSGPQCGAMAGSIPRNRHYTCNRPPHDATTPHVACGPGPLAIATWEARP